MMRGLFICRMDSEVAVWYAYLATRCWISGVRYQSDLFNHS